MSGTIQLTQIEGRDSLRAERGEERPGFRQPAPDKGPAQHIAADHPVPMRIEPATARGAPGRGGNGQPDDRESPGRDIEAFGLVRCAQGQDERGQRARRPEDEIAEHQWRGDGAASVQSSPHKAPPNRTAASPCRQSRARREARHDRHGDFASAPLASGGRCPSRTRADVSTAAVKSSVSVHRVHNLAGRIVAMA